MRIAITGASGYIGGWLVKTLEARGHETCTQDIRSGSDSVFDLGLEQCRQHWLDSIRPDLVLHLAAKYGRVWGETGMAETAALNAGLTAELARDCAAGGIPLMFVSSSEVYGRTSGTTVIPEFISLHPRNMYGMSKKWGEEACRAYARDGLQIVRLNMPYGPAAILPQPGTTPHHSGRVGNRGYNALHTMLWQASHGLPITVHENTERCFTWVGDAMTGIALVAESGEPGTWNVCRDDDHVSMLELASRCVSMVPGSGSEITVKPPDSQITPAKRLDAHRLRQLGWKPTVSLEEGMRETLAYVANFDEQGVWRGNAH